MNLIITFFYLSRCKCGYCKIMKTDDECKCCQEIPEMQKELQDLKVLEGYNENNIPNCITQHEGFVPQCTNKWVLRTAFVGYKYDGKPIKKIKTVEE